MTQVRVRAGGFHRDDEYLAISVESFFFGGGAVVTELLKKATDAYFVADLAWGWGEEEEGEEKRTGLLLSSMLVNIYFCTVCSFLLTMYAVYESSS